MYKTLQKLFVALLFIVQLCLCADNYLLIETVNGNFGQCNGQVISSLFYQTNQCYNGLFVTCDSESAVATISSYGFVDCLGSPTNVAKFDIGCSENYLYSCQDQVLAQESSILNQEYFNSSCADSPYFAETKATGICVEGVIITCSIVLNMNYLLIDHSCYMSLVVWPHLWRTFIKS
ncbi:hypothetical protein PPL_07151 [Heterostelium album PN500]|uniref:Transmembrane protein n=1 Tax=Heterostelium pallidum (strain ATCC 26659 / Pp 5 / PN500) TaxID=670386 RepID=D3BEI9_HETP5|nr:hypothetical protein PPL_07151 [Heterostelium album PN500]EFA80320.1 hypothetical protein PPL_07151 [Heterostelium album PN500]|eukprot:XP_020432440.1 hypothetical protein PPL_07151 [Heterostelium album PN500]